MSNYKVPQLSSFEWQQAVKDKDLSTPVGLTPAKGDRYIVKATGSGDWTGHNNAIATYNGATWDFVEAVEGLICYINDEDLVYIYTTSWIIWIGMCTYLKTFTNGDLSTGKLTVTHNLNSTYPIIVVYDNNEKEIIPDDITYQSVNALEIDLTSYGSLAGTWHARVFGSTPVEIKQTEIKDADGDTKVETEKNADEDKVRVTTAGVQRTLVDSDGLTLQSGASVNEFSTDGTMAGNSDDAVPTEKAVKTYVDLTRAKFFVLFADDGTISASNNVSGVVHNSTGNWTITFTTGFATSSWVGLVNSVRTDRILAVSTRNTGTCVVTCEDPASGLADAAYVYVVGFGA